MANYCNFCAGNGKHEDSCKRIGVVLCVTCTLPIPKNTSRYTKHPEGYTHNTSACK
jgi:hypothetical protein